MKYLLLGGSGFIGSHLAAALSKKHAVTITGQSPNFKLDGVNYIQLNFTSCQDFSKYIKDVDVIIHLISTTIPSDNLCNIDNEITDNIFPTIILLKNAAELNKKIVFISSGGTVYGQNSRPNKESSPTNPICSYGVNKLIIEKYLELFHHFYGLNYKIVRLSNPYSGKVYHGKKQGIVPIIIDNIKNDTTITIWGKDQVRDYIYIDDAINAIISILNYKGQTRTFNVGTGVGHTANDIIKLAEAMLNKKAHIKYCPKRKCDVDKNILDISLIKQKTSWAPTISLSKGIEKIINQN